VRFRFCICETFGRRNGYRGLRRSVFTVRANQSAERIKREDSIFSLYLYTARSLVTEVISHREENPHGKYLHVGDSLLKQETRTLYLRSTISAARGARSHVKNVYLPPRSAVILTATVRRRYRLFPALSKSPAFEEEGTRKSETEVISRLGNRARITITRLSRG